MKIFCSRVYLLLCMLAIKWQGFAQTMGDDDDEPIATKKTDDEDELSLLEEYPDWGIHITFSDVLTVVFVIICCYVFGKIWKGCTYLIILLAVLYYYYVR